MFPAFLTTIFFSLSAISGNRCARTFGGLEANFYRLVIASSMLAIYANVFGKSLSGDAASVFVLSGIIGVGVGDMLFFQALPRLGSRLTVLLIQCLSVPFAILVEWLWLGTAPLGKQLLWIVLILGGITMALFPINHAQSTRRQKMWGVVFAVFAAVGNGFGAVLSRKAYALAQASGQNIDGPTAAYRRVLGGLLVAAIVLLIVRWPLVYDRMKRLKFSLPEEYKSKWRNIWPWVVTTSLAGQTLGVTSFQWALKNYPTGIVLPIVATTPLVAIPFSRLLENERPTLRSILGGVLAVLGVIGLLLAR